MCGLFINHIMMNLDTIYIMHYNLLLCFNILYRLALRLNYFNVFFQT